MARGRLSNLSKQKEWGKSESKKEWKGWHNNLLGSQGQNPKNEFKKKVRPIGSHYVL